MRSRFLSFALAGRSGKVIGASRDFEDLIGSAELIIGVISVS
jgi:hypothetical protein